MQTAGDVQSARPWRVFLGVAPLLLNDLLKRQLSRPWVEFIEQADLAGPQLPPVDVVVLDALAPAPAQADVTIRLVCAGTRPDTGIDALPLVIVESMEELGAIFSRLCPRRPTVGAHVDHAVGGGGA